MRQINRAIDHAINGEYECAITLAGAAEGILPNTDKPHFLQKEKELANRPELKAAGGAVKPNDYINWLKHGSLVRGGPRIESVTIPAEESIKTVWRAITKYKAVYDDLSPQMLHFRNWAKEWLKILGKYAALSGLAERLGGLRSVPEGMSSGGSATNTKMIGMERLCCSIAAVAGVEAVIIKSA